MHLESSAASRLLLPLASTQSSPSIDCIGLQG